MASKPTTKIDLTAKLRSKRKSSAATATTAPAVTTDESGKPSINEAPRARLASLRETAQDPSVLTPALPAPPSLESHDYS
ncbi:hypothetical protein KEM55_001937, partial [Ascosphaera atra]